MSHRFKKFFYSALSVLVLGLTGFFVYARFYAEGSNPEEAEEGLPDYFVDRYGKIIVPEEPDTEDARDTRGTEGNPYFILEIVPYDGMAEFGYQIAGCEPIDVDAAARDGVYIPCQSTYYNTTNGVVFRFWPEEKPYTFPGNQTATMNQYGTMTYVDDGSGQYVLSEPLEEGDDAAKAEYVAVGEDEEGDFLWIPLSAEQCYAMTDEEKAAYEGEFVEELTAGTSFHMFFEDVEFVFGSGSTVTHKNTFLRESVGLAYEFDSNGIRHKITDETVIAEKIKNYKAVVYTVTPEDLNTNPELVERADLIVISSKAKSLPTSNGCPNGIYTELQGGDTSVLGNDGKVQDKYKYIPYLKKHLFGYEDKTTTGQYARKENKPGATFKTNLIDWSIVLKIYERATDQEHMCPIVSDLGIYQNTYNDTSSGLVKEVKLKMMFGDESVKDGSTKKGTQDNMTKLFLMLYQMESPVFELLYGDPTDAANALFSSQDLKKTSGAKVKKKDGTYLKTGVFNYDNGRAHNKKGTEDSRVYWNDLTLLPWKLMPNSNGYNNVGEYGPFMATYGITVESGGYDMTGGDAQNSIRNGLMVYFGDEKLTTKLLENSEVKNNIFGAQVYEYFDAINGPEEGAPASVTVAECLAYLIGGVNSQISPVYTNRQYKILELQPSSTYETDFSPLFWKLLIAAYTNSVAEPVVETMTTSEFIGSHVDCISEYDLIYVGMRKSSTDPTMQFTGGVNYVYAHTGPKITLSETYRALYGWLRNEKIAGLADNLVKEREKYFVYSGNDLTTAALKKLTDYNQAGFPILFGDGFFSSYSDTSYVMANTIDRNSNIYKLGDVIDDANTSAIYKTQLGSSPVKTEKFRQMLSTDNKKVEMVFSIMPVIYNSENEVKDRYINGYDNGYRTLYYKFKVNAPAGTSYQVNLFVDSNNDGTFTPGQEDVGAEIFRVNANGTQGGTVTSGVVEAGKSYYVKRQLGSHVGAVHWKLELVKNNKVYASESGVSAIQARSDGSEDVHIRVLQILPKNVSASLKLPTSQQDANQIGGSSKKFYEKINQLNGLSIQFYRMTQDEILQKINGAGGQNYLYDNYDMLVLGFADIYDGVSDITLLNKIKEFIARGKAVLYTHDTSSGIGKQGTGTFQVWGRTITEACRDLFGMDRYGACIFYETGNLDAIPTTKDVPYEPSTSSSIVKKYMNSVNTPLIQGLSNGILYRTTNGNNINAYEVTKVNEGAITQYPFTIEDKIPVAQTHPQYYQLDMEQEDIVVWYCLDGGTEGKSQSYESTYYGTSKNDVRNNYYIYNKGNVTYSGMGHVNSGLVNLPDAEIELFINTFVAAYRASAEGVKVEVLNDDATGTSSGDQYLCVDVDSSDADEIIGNDIELSYTLQVDNEGVYTEAGEFSGKSKRVYFRLVDNNSFGSATYKVRAVPTNGAAADKTLAVYEKQSGEFVDNVNRVFEGNTVYYYVDVPINIETNTDENGVVSNAVGTTEMKISVTMTYMVGSESFPVDANTNVYIVPRGLYDLD